MEEDWKTAVRSIGELFHSETVHVVLENNVVPYSDDFEKVTFAIGVIALICCFVGVTTNAIIICLAKKILTRADRQETQHLCILSTAIADLIFTAIHCPTTFAMYALQAFLPINACLFLYYATHMSTVASCLSLLCLNMDKFVSLHFPLRYHDLISYKRGKIGILIVWLLALSWATFFVFGPLNRFKDGCGMSTYEPYGFIIYLSFFTMFFLVPLTISFGISLYIFFVARLARKSQNRAAATLDGDSLTAQSMSIFCGKCCWNDVNRILRSDSSQNGNGGTIVESNGHESSLQSTIFNLRTVLFVFSATTWSFCTLVPYRVFYMAFQFYQVGWAEWLILAAYALIISYPAGNPFVTVITQPQYRRLVMRMIRERKFKSRESTRSTVTVRKGEGAVSS